MNSSMITMYGGCADNGDAGYARTQQHAGPSEHSGGGIGGMEQVSDAGHMAVSVLELLSYVRQKRLEVNAEQEAASRAANDIETEITTPIIINVSIWREWLYMVATERSSCANLMT